MALPLFVVSTADSEGVLGVLTISTIELVHTPHKIFQDRFTHTKARNWVSRDSGTDFRIFLETNNQNIINILHNTREHN
jgi:hypothetical protein